MAPATVGETRAAKRHTARQAAVAQSIDEAVSNMALAENEEQYRAVAGVFQELLRRENELAAELQQAEKAAAGPADKDTAIESALSVLDRLGELASDPDNLDRSENCSVGSTCGCFCVFDRRS